MEETNYILRIKEQETLLNLLEHDNDDDDDDDDEVHFCENRSVGFTRLSKGSMTKEG